MKAIPREYRMASFRYLEDAQAFANTLGEQHWRLHTLSARHVGYVVVMEWVYEERGL